MSQYGYGLDYRRMTIGLGLIFNLLLQAHRSTLRRLDFTTGKRVNRGDKLLRIAKRIVLANELERTRRVLGILQVTPLGWLQSRLKMGNKSSSPTIYIGNYKIQVQKENKSKTSQKCKAR